MLPLNIGLILFRIDQGGLRIVMAEKRLELFKRHPAAEADSRESMPELVREDVHIDLLRDLAEDTLQGAFGEGTVRSADVDENGIRLIIPGIKICLERDFRFRIEVHGALLIPFTMTDQDGTIIPVDIRQAHGSALADAAAGGEQKVDQRLFPDVRYFPAAVFQVNRCQRLPAVAGILDFFDLRAGIAKKVIIIHEPLEELIDDDADTLQIAVGGIILRLEVIQVEADIVRLDISVGLAHHLKKVDQLILVLHKRAVSQVGDGPGGEIELYHIGDFLGGDQGHRLPGDLIIIDGDVNGLQGG